VTWEFPKNVVPEYLLHYEKDIRVYDVSPLGQFAAAVSPPAVAPLVIFCPPVIIIFYKPF
jgi:hypothetical protein